MLNISHGEYVLDRVLMIEDFIIYLYNVPEGFRGLVLFGVQRHNLCLFDFVQELPNSFDEC